jgi:predicted metalloprotease with PDZ domain
MSVHPLRAAITTGVLLFLALAGSVAAPGGAAPPPPPAPADDLSDRGLPIAKRPFVEGLDDAQGLSDHFQFDSRDYLTARADLHGTIVEVGVHLSASAAGGPPPEEFVRFVTDAFHAAWHVFGGFAYDRYAVKVRAADDLHGFSLSPVGVSITATDYRGPGIWELVAHEMFHSWVGKLIRHEKDGSDNLFQKETWISEGAAVYYSFRILGAVRGERDYRHGMGYRWDFYKTRVGTDVDLSVADLSAAIGTSPDDDPEDRDRGSMLYARGGLLCYTLDRELTRRGSNLDALMRRLYEERGLRQLTWRQSDLPAMADSLVGDPLAGFFDGLVATNGRLPLDGRFELLPRE